MIKFDPDYLRKEEAKIAAEYAAFCDSQKVMRQIIKESPKGTGLRYVGRVPICAVAAHSEASKYLNPQADSKDQVKEIDALLKRFPEFDLRGL